MSKHSFKVGDLVAHPWSREPAVVFLDVSNEAGSDLWLKGHTLYWIKLKDGSKKRCIGELLSFWEGPFILLTLL